MLTASLDLAMLKAVDLAASTEETRYYLNGVFLEITPRRVIYVATNGHVLLAGCRDVKKDEPSHTLVGEFIIPSPVIAKLKLPKKIPNPVGELSAAAVTTPGKQRLTLGFMGEEIGFAPIDGSFPDWRRVVPASSAMPEKENLDAFDYNPDYLKLLDKAGALLNLGRARVMPRGGCPALAHYAEQDLVGVIMPMRAADYRGSTRPAWVDAPRAVQSDAA